MRGWRFLRRSRSQACITRGVGGHAPHSPMIRWSATSLERAAGAPKLLAKVRKSNNSTLNKSTRSMCMYDENLYNADRVAGSPAITDERPTRFAFRMSVGGFRFYEPFLLFWPQIGSYAVVTCFAQRSTPWGHALYAPTSSPAHRALGRATLLYSPSRRYNLQHWLRDSFHSE